MTCCVRDQSASLEALIHPAGYSSGALYVSVCVLCVWLLPIALSEGRSNKKKKRMNKKRECEMVAGRADPCGFVREACGDVGNLVDYLDLIYCGERCSPTVGMALLGLWLLLLLSMLGTTADVFFVEQLEFMSDRFRLSADVAGATLMAFGNGAPDAFTAWNAIENASDFSLVLSELLGAAIFVTTVVLGAVILSSRRDCSLDPKPFARDATTLALSVFAIAACVLDGRIQLVESATVVGLYALYVLYIISSRDNKPLPVENEPTAETTTVDEAGEFQTETSSLSLRGVHWDSTSSRFSKAFHVLEWPFAVARHLSIPAATFESWGPARRRVAASSVLGAVFVVALECVDDPGQLNQRVRGLQLWLWLALIGAFFAGLVWIRTADDAPPKLIDRTFLVIVGFVAAIAWLDLLASETVAVFETLGAASGLSSAVLGSTLLAWGNCVGDFIADTAIARAGNQRAAVASVFNSPLFSQILATGVAAGWYNCHHGALAIKLDKEALLSFAAIATSLALTSLVGVASGSRLPRPYAFVLFAVYVLYVVATLTIEFDQDRHTIVHTQKQQHN